MSVIEVVKASGSQSVQTQGTVGPQAVWENFPKGNASSISNITAISKTPFYWQEDLQQNVTPKSIAFKLSAVNTSTHVSFSVHFGVYTLANSTSANLLASASDAFVVSSNSSASFSGFRDYVLTSPGTATAISTLSGGQYVFGMMFSAAATSSMNQVLFGASNGLDAGVLGNVQPGTNSVVTATNSGVARLVGQGSTTVNAMPAAVSAADLVNQGTAASGPIRPYLFIRS